MVTGTPDTDPETQPRAMAEVKIGGRVYPVVSRPHCRTCQHPDRLHIEQQIMSGVSYAAIAEWAADQEPGRLPPPGTDALASHAKAHMGIPGRIQRAIIDQRAEDLALDSEDPMAADYVTLARLLVRTGLEGLADGTLKPALGDVLAAAKFLADHDGSDDENNISVWRETLMTYLEVSRRYIPDTAWAAFRAELSGHPNLRKNTPALPPAPERNQQ